MNIFISIHLLCCPDLGQNLDPAVNAYDFFRPYKFHQDRNEYVQNPTTGPPTSD